MAAGLTGVLLDGISNLLANPLLDSASAFVVNELINNNVLTNLTVVSLLLQALSLEKYGPVTKYRFRDEYDYIVVGGGSAGSTVSTRLSENPDVTVLLLEAGGDPPIFSEIPLIELLLLGSDADWYFKTVPQKRTGRALKNQELYYNQGKALGGGSDINAMLFVRGNRKNYDKWAEMGAEGWSYEEVLPYFKKLEHLEDAAFANANGGEGYHGYDGPITASQPNYKPELREAVLEAARELNYPILDSNGKRQKGFFPLYASIRNGKRCSTAKGYLATADDRENFDIVKTAFVTRVIFEGSRAVGVEVEYKGRKHTVRARKEVIVSAGAVNTPKLLMLSGVGPREELDKFKIPVVADLPVGRNLQDHLNTIFTYHLSPAILPAVAKGVAQLPLYIANHSGILSSPTSVDVLAFLTKDGKADDDDSEPDYQLYFAESANILVKKIFNIKDESFNAYYAPHVGQSGMFCFSQLLTPKSRGTVTLQSTNPNDPPLIDPNYLADEEDADKMVQGLKKCNEIAKTSAMKRIGVKLWENKLPECEEFDLESDEYLRCFVGSLTNTIWHPVGTCRMGSVDDPTAVVDPQLRVKGMDGLRVVDASVMPRITTGNTNIPTIMIAEKAADMIKETLRSQQS